MIPTTGTGYDYTVDWGDGSIDSGVTGNIIHTYAVPGTYTVSITGSFPRIFFNKFSGNPILGDEQKILTVEQWGDIDWTSMDRAFTGCKNLTIPATDAPDLTQVTDLSYMFTAATSFNRPLNHWNVSGIKIMERMFLGASSFNQPLNSWDVNNVNDMRGMFAGASSFNQPLNNWDVNNVNDMRGMFANASSFNQPLNSWNVNNVNNMTSMFSNASSFNQPLNNWDVSNVSYMHYIFSRATSFNQPLNSWDVSKVTNMERTFYDATSFNQPLDNWNVSNVTKMDDIFNDSGISTPNYDLTLTSWSKLPTLKNNLQLGADDMKFCRSDADRQKLIDDFGWVISGDQKNCEAYITNFDNGLARNSAISFSIGTSAYMGLGKNATGLLADFYKITPNVGQTTPLASYPGVARRDAVAFVIAGKAYVGTGQDTDGNYLQDFYAYDPELDQWAAIASLPGAARASAVAFTLSGEGYVGTGSSAAGELADFWKYNPTTNTWTEVTGFSGNARQEATAFVLDGKAYVTGGVSYTSGTQQYSDMQEYNPATVSWTEKVFADSDLSFQNAAAFTLQGSAYIAYGNRAYITRYDPVSNETEKLGDVFEIDPEETGDKRAHPIAFTLADTAYFGFGSSGFFTTAYYADLHKFFSENEPPTDLSLSANVVAENTPANQSIGQFASIDPYDQRPHTYALSGGDGINDVDNSFFEIFDGFLYAKAPLNFEEKEEYAVYVETFDASGAGFGKAFTIEVMDVNEAPLFGDGSMDLLENAENGSTVVEFSLTDPESEAITYSIVSGNSDNAFIIDGNLLKVNQTEELNFEAIPFFNLTVSANDGTFSTNASVLISLLDVDEAPVIDSPTFEIAENSTNGLEIGEVLAFDPEQTAVTLEITSGNDENIFSINENNRVIVEKMEMLDFETVQQFTFEVTATSGVLSNVGMVTINVTDVNEAPIAQDTTFNVREGSVQGTVIGKVEATDPENDVISYSITSGNIDNIFTIDAEGNLIANDPSGIDVDTTPSYDLSVEISDGELQTTVVITIKISPPLSAQALQNKVLIYPNPAKEMLYIEFGDLDGNKIQLEVLNLSGQTVLSGKATSQLDITTLSSGTYLLRVSDGKEIVFRKFLKE